MAWEDKVRARAHPLFWAVKCCYTIPLITIGLTIFALINLDPSFSIQTLYVPSLNKYINSSSAINNSVIFFDLKLENNYSQKSLHYDAMKLTFYSGANKSCMSIGTYTVPGFHQGEDRTAHRRDVVAITALSSGAKADFMVDLETKVMFKNFFWYTKKKNIVVGGKVEVDDFGMNVGKKTVELLDHSGTTAVLQLRPGVLVVTCLLLCLFFQ